MKMHYATENELTTTGKTGWDGIVRIPFVQDRGHWRAGHIPYAGNLLTSRVAVSFSRRALLHAICGLVGWLVG